ncbi:hypothetical protein BC828DRAFT_34180 [Blastocladiella britannica]|nr:hypothetical protein BC828DRAFT_34180 [Blastocladiella britannica]
MAKDLPPFRPAQLPSPLPTARILQTLGLPIDDSCATESLLRRPIAPDNPSALADRLDACHSAKCYAVLEEHTRTVLLSAPSSNLSLPETLHLWHHRLLALLHLGLASAAAAEAEHANLVDCADAPWPLRVLAARLPALAADADADAQISASGAVSGTSGDAGGTDAPPAPTSPPVVSTSSAGRAAASDPRLLAAVANLSKAASAARLEGSPVGEALAMRALARVAAFDLRDPRLADRIVGATGLPPTGLVDPMHLVGWWTDIAAVWIAAAQWVRVDTAVTALADLQGYGGANVLYIRALTVSAQGDAVRAQELWAEAATALRSTGARIAAASDPATGLAPLAAQTAAQAAYRRHLQLLLAPPPTPLPLLPLPTAVSATITPSATTTTTPAMYAADTAWIATATLLLPAALNNAAVATALAPIDAVPSENSNAADPLVDAWMNAARRTAFADPVAVANLATWIDVLPPTPPLSGSGSAVTAAARKRAIAVQMIKVSDSAAVGSLRLV